MKSVRIAFWTFVAAFYDLAQRHMPAVLFSRRLMLWCDRTFGTTPWVWLHTAHSLARARANAIKAGPPKGAEAGAHAAVLKALDDTAHLTYPQQYVAESFRNHRKPTLVVHLNSPQDENSI